MLSEPTVRPRHRIRAYGRVVKASGEAEYKRFLDFLAASTSTEKTVLLSNQNNQQHEPRYEMAQPAPVQVASPIVRHSRGFDGGANVAASGVINFAPEPHSTRVLASDSQMITNQLAGGLSSAFAPPSTGAQYASQPALYPGKSRFTTHLSADFASQMAAEFKKTTVESNLKVASDLDPMSTFAALVEPEQHSFIESVSVLEEPLLPTQVIGAASYQTAQSSSAPANYQAGQFNANPLSLAQTDPGAISEPEQFISQAANMLEEWFGKRSGDDDEASDDNEFVDGPTYSSRNAESPTDGLTAIGSTVIGATTGAMPHGGAIGASGSIAGGLPGAMANGSAASGGSAPASTPGSLISRLSRISQQELNAIREATAPQKKAPRRTPPSSRARGQGRKHWLRPSLIPMDNGNRKELYASGAAIVKDAVGRVCEVSAANGASIAFTYDPEGHLNGFVRTNVSGKVHSTGGRDKHGVVVRDADGRVRAQGESMSVDPRGCLSIRRFDGQFWCVDLVRGIHLERRILQDLDGQWNSLTALLTSDGFRMVTRFQKLADTTESYRRYGDWLSSETSKFRFYGRDGSVIQFDSDEDLQSLRPSRIWQPGSRPIDEEWQGIRQAGTAWDSVHQYVSQYLSTL